MGRKFKGGVAKVICTIGDAVESTSEQDGQLSSNKTQKSNHILQRASKNAVVSAWSITMTRQKEE